MFYFVFVIELTMEVWDNTTPLGLPVVPEEKRIKAGNWCEGI